MGDLPAIDRRYPMSDSTQEFVMPFRTAAAHEASAGSGRLRRRRAGAPVGALRDATAAAAETVALVLGEFGPLPESEQDVTDLVLRLRAHVSALGAELPLDCGPMRAAWQLASEAIPAGYMPSRVYLRQLALVTRDLIEERRRSTASVAGTAPDQRPAGLRRLRPPSRNTVRILVFGLALITLIIAGSVPRG
ncbi:DUF6415 family natural product biosynthesis protein [Streptomyces sp. NRRL S-448]|uniref:DUF6415 family natural product biosynthesis protein n=1 Tax=Streptomyces sp. NRRL S-448 TaxID=1463907 RepID=UPI003566D594